MDIDLAAYAESFVFSLLAHASFIKAAADVAAMNEPLRNGQSKDHFHDVLAQKTTGGGDETYTSQTISDMYHDGFIEIISKRTPGLMGRIKDSLSCFRGHHPQQTLSETDFGFSVHFGNFQRLYMRSLHTKLISLAINARKSGFSESPEEALEGLDTFGTVLEKYVRAVQNHEYMAKYALEPNDPFIATSRRHHDRIFFEAALFDKGLGLEDLLPPHLSRTSGESNTQPSTAAHDGETEGQRSQREWVERLLKASIPAGPWETVSKGGLVNTPTTSARKAFWERVGAAVIGGAFLIGPMWILSLKRDLFVHLGVATACVIAFGFSLSFYLKTVDGVFAATLAYAAVIMVFVGIVIEETGSKGLEMH